MAKRRMFTLDIVDSDAFLDMPLTTQALYFHLAMRADDDGFIGNAKKIARSIGVGDDDMKVLFAKRFILPFESGVVVIKHWRMHNLIRHDRYQETVYQEEKSKLVLKRNKAYTEIKNGGQRLEIPDVMDTTATKWQPNGTTGKVRLGKERLGNKEYPKGITTNLGNSTTRVFNLSGKEPLDGEIELDEIEKGIEEMRSKN
jgi:hypothetical protein